MEFLSINIYENSFFIIIVVLKVLEFLAEFDKKSSELCNKTLELNENMYEISRDTLKHVWNF